MAKLRPLSAAKKGPTVRGGSGTKKVKRVPNSSGGGGSSASTPPSRGRTSTPTRAYRPSAGPSPTQRAIRTGRSVPGSAYKPPKAPKPTTYKSLRSQAKVNVKRAPSPSLPDLPKLSIPKGITKALAAPAKLTEQVAVKAVEAPKQRITKLGKTPTLGKPKLGEVIRASNKGKLRKNRRGQLTTPRTRKASKQLHHATKRYRKAVRHAREPLPLPTPSQRQIARTVLRTGKQMGATPKELLAATETGLVESNFSNPGQASSDLDSAGWRQERASIYGGGPTGPRNVKAAAQRWFEESRAAGRGAGMTPGNLAQTVQGSAFPERYDQVASTAVPIVKAFAGHKPIPKPVKKQYKKAVHKAKEAGIKVPKVPKGAAPAKAKASKLPGIVRVGKIAQNRFGLTVGENPAFGGVDPGVHVPGSYHNSGNAIDVSGDPAQMMAFDRFVAKKWGKGVTELFYDPGISIKDGAITSDIGGHSDHVHVAIVGPGQTVGGYTAGPGGAAFYGVGGSVGAAQASAYAGAQAAAQGKGLTGQAVLNKLEQYGAGVGERTGKEPAQVETTLAQLEKKYGI